MQRFKQIFMQRFKDLEKYGNHDPQGSHSLLPTVPPSPTTLAYGE